LFSTSPWRAAYWTGLDSRPRELRVIELLLRALGHIVFFDGNSKVGNNVFPNVYKFSLSHLLVFTFVLVIVFFFLYLIHGYIVNYRLQYFKRKTNLFSITHVRMTTKNEEKGPRISLIFADKTRFLGGNLR
jgi:preprotein translocase subunit SecG